MKINLGIIYLHLEEQSHGEAAKDYYSHRDRYFSDSYNAMFGKGYYYQRLHERTVEAANSNNISTDKLMDIQYIRWELDIHVLGYVLGFPSCAQADLNVDETLWSIIKRALGV